MTDTLILLEFYSSPFKTERGPLTGSFGQLFFPDGSFVYTCERSWVNNEPFKSCIPPGVYTLRKRRSGVVERTSGGTYLEGWEVTDVPGGRTFIMLHPANWPHQLAGCIAPGMGFGMLRDALAVFDSGAAFDVLMKQLEARDEWYLDIRRNPNVEYP
ncbi:DUF5675 family protein [uncultured Marinobacter sp.]|uniref:DUF5675 family protein n=1 Tax=uncultured Marinobacter sp. TaxID=187379 RepID=UPI002585F1C1|nr:DUF5675 family protein [uncultured Marinobacter sp.]